MSHNPSHRERAYDSPAPTGSFEEEDTPGPLGVPRDYTTSVHLNAPSMGTADAAEAWSGPRVVTPRYFSGDQWALAKKLGSEDRAAVQLAMKELGLIGPQTRVVLGAWDQTSANAFKEVLSWANVLGTSWLPALQDMQANSATFGAAEEEDLPEPVEVTNPEDIERSLRDYFRESLGSGRAVPDDKIRAMVAAYQGEQVSSQRAGYAAEKSGGTVVAPPSLETFAEMEAKKADPVGFDARKVVAAADVLMQMLSGER